MALMEISIIPLGTGSTSLSKHIASVVKLIEKSGLSYRLSDMGTTIEGEAVELLELAKRLHETPFSQDVKRVYTVMKLDDRRDKRANIGEKVKSVEKRL